MLGLTDDQRTLAESIADWAASVEASDLVKGSEGKDEPFGQVWAELGRQGVVAIALPETLGGGGGTFLDLACAVEACGFAMVPGPVLSTALAATLLTEQADAPGVREVLSGVADGTVSVGVGRRSGLADGATATHLLLEAADVWTLVETGRAGATVTPGRSADLTRRSAQVLQGDIDPVATVSLDANRVRDVAVTLAAAEAAGIARWALRTAVEYAKVREQFGRTIGSFQSIKHLCAQMLEASECASAVAWDAASAYDEDAGQHAFAAATAGVVALEAAVRNAQDCIQVLGGIGFTWEHDAHLYLRRAMVLRRAYGVPDRWRVRLADLAAGGARREPQVDLGGAGEQVREQARARITEISQQPEADRRVRLAEAGLATPHWPAPYGLGAGPAEQLVIDDEMRRAGVVRPDLGIGAWAAPTVLEHGTLEQRERFVAPTLRGEISWCQLFSEPGAGSDLASLRTKAVRVDGGWSLSGQKVWTSLAREADWAICLARTNPDAPQHQGITYFLVDMRTGGIDIRPLREITGEALFNEVFLDDVFVPDDCVVGDVDGGWRLARTTLANERVAISGSSLGVSVERALALASPPGASHAQRLRIGTAVADAATAKALGLRATLRSVAGQGPGPESSVQKLVGVRQRQDSAELVLDLLGERAYVVAPDDEVAQDAWYEALNTRCLSIAGGTTQVLRNVAAERILGLPRD